MTTIDDILQGLNNIDILELCEDAINDDANVVEATIKEQLQRGEGGDAPMPEYSRTSKDFYGKPDGGIRLFETGAFYRGITASAQFGFLEIFSTDSKNEMLEAIYSAEQPLKLNERSISELHGVLQQTAVNLLILKLSV